MDVSSDYEQYLRVYDSAFQRLSDNVPLRPVLRGDEIVSWMKLTTPDANFYDKPNSHICFFTFVQPDILRLYILQKRVIGFLDLCLVKNLGRM